MITSCISHPANEQCVVIRKWQIIFCEGNACAAALISFFEFWHNWKPYVDLRNRKLNDVAEWSGDNRNYCEDNHQLHTMQEIAQGILNLFPRSTIANAIKYLELKHVISVNGNPNPRYSFDSTQYYIFHPEVINTWLNEKYQKKMNEPTLPNIRPLSTNINASHVLKRTV